MGNGDIYVCVSLVVVVPIFFFVPLSKDMGVVNDVATALGLFSCAFVMIYYTYTHNHHWNSTWFEIFTLPFI